MTIVRALLGSLIVHLLATQLPLGWLQPADPAGGGPRPPLRFELVDAAAPPETDRPPSPDGAPAGRTAGNVPRHATLPMGAGRPEERNPDGAHRPPRDRGSHAVDPSGPPDSAPSPTTGAANPPTPVRSAAPATRTAPAPSTPAALRERLALDDAGLSDVAMGRLRPLLKRWAERPERRTASSYRDLLRTYIDVLMGYPYPVAEWLQRHPARFLAELEVVVAADGSFRFTRIFFYPGAGVDGRVRDYYRRVLRETSGHPFLPPAEAGLPAPHRLDYKLLNPETR